MGDLLSKPSTNPSDSNLSIDMSASQPSQTQKSKPDEGNPKPKSPETQTPIHASDQPAVQEKETLESQTPIHASDQPAVQEKETLEESQGQNDSKKDQEGEYEEEGECGFCLFMKEGGCRESFTTWENCVQDAEKKKEDIIEKCSEMTRMLHQCMEAHQDYYGPLLAAEKAAVKELEREKGKEADKNAEEEAVKELEREKGKVASASSSGQPEQNSADKGSG
ncbi:uncharacterized protein LOC132304777 [Cornus florida]|uniref:uncharacterized protein LOC132304777 n=1 Tax=Cornus florida TaxID=4283 RepID=UPI00289691E5|nr:uncharacterized protein LOC132304777 [Cornus florida]